MIAYVQSSCFTLVRKVMDLSTLSVQGNLCIFQKDKVNLRIDLSYIPKVSSTFHRSQELNLPSFCHLKRYIEALDEIQRVREKNQ